LLVNWKKKKLCHGNELYNIVCYESDISPGLLLASLSSYKQNELGAYLINYLPFLIWSMQHTSNLSRTNLLMNNFDGVRCGLAVGHVHKKLENVQQISW